MRISWKKRVRIRMNDELLTNFIKDLLGHSRKWQYRSIFQELDIDLHVADIKNVRKDILDWLERRSLGSYKEETNAL